MTDNVPSRVYGRRKGRPLRVRKSQLMESLLPRLQIDLPQESFDPRALFTPRPETVWLEIGFGGGEHLAAQAETHPDIGFIGCEPFVNGVASLLDHIDSRQIKNIRILPDDARKLIDLLPPGSIARCFVLFADPWPKARHEERRFIGPHNIPHLARVMAQGSELRLATDDAQLAVWMKQAMDAAPEFDLVSHAATPPDDWVQTRYEEKALQAGRQPVYMSYKRI